MALNYYCPTCGSLLDPRVVFCGKCGRRISGPANLETMELAPAKKARVWPVLLLCGFLALLLVAFIGALSRAPGTYGSAARVVTPTIILVNGLLPHQTVTVFRTLDAMHDEMNQIVNGYPTPAATDVFEVPPGTRATVNRSVQFNSTVSLLNVTILDGLHQGEIGWVLSSVTRSA